MSSEPTFPAGPSRPSPTLRERLRSAGERALSDAECLGLLVAPSRPATAALRSATALLERFGSLAGIAAAEPAELAACAGLGPARAAVLRAAFGLAHRLARARLAVGAALRDAADVARLVREATRDDPRESFHAVLLDARHRVLATHVVGVGTLRSAPVHPREVFRPALRAGAAALVVAHNHPSGDARPSDDDRLVTERLRQVGELCGVELLDHVVVGAQTYFSFADDREHPLPPLADCARVADS
ncbi:MAG: DNA repair protein RadC [Planctomycetes bacterium]|nr:DNA repair protein RadC [Planctomycetota bacterium]